MDKNSSNLIPKLYYAITPVFILLDYIGGINFRVAVLDNFAMYKGLYYGFCIICGLLVFLVPRSSSFVAVIESIIIIMMTVFSIFIPYTRIISGGSDVLDLDFQGMNIVQPNYIINLCLAGSIAVITFRTSIAEITGNRD